MQRVYGRKTTTGNLQALLAGLYAQVLDWLAVSLGLLHLVSFVTECAVYTGQ